jgi:hypothetical protein
MLPVGVLLAHHESLNLSFGKPDQAVRAESGSENLQGETGDDKRQYHIAGKHPAAKRPAR